MLKVLFLTYGPTSLGELFGFKSQNRQTCYDKAQPLTQIYIQESLTGMQTVRNGRLENTTIQINNDFQRNVEIKTLRRTNRQQHRSITLTRFSFSTPILQSWHKNSYWQGFVLKRALKSAPSVQRCSSSLRLSPTKSLSLSLSLNGHSCGCSVLSLLITPCS